MKKITSIVLAAVVLMSTMVFATGCESKQEIDLADYVTFDGYSGYATMNDEPEIEDYDEKLSKLKDEKSEAKDDDDDDKYDELKEEISSLKDLKKALDCVEFKLKKGDDGKLANGDKITVKAKYRDEKVEKYNVKFTSDEFEMEVKDLEEKEVIDPFDKKYMTITFSGMDGDGNADVEETDEADGIGIYYSTDPSYDLKNNDKVTVTASLYSDEYMLKDSEDGSSATKEFTVTGLGEIPENLSGVDTTEVDKVLLDEAKEEAEAEKGETDEGYEFGIYGEDYRFSELQILSAGNLKEEKKLYGYKKTSTDNDTIYAIIYSQPCKVKVVDPSYGTKLKKGAVKTVNAYFISYISNDIMVSDNKLVFEDEYYYPYASKNFATVADAEKAVKDYYSGYTYSVVQ